jgi:DNA-binding MarR family transcriptional regulator
LTAAKRVYIHVMTKSAVDLSACKACRCLAARRYARELTRLYEGRLRPHGLRATQFSVLAALALKGPTAVTELAATLGLDRTTLTRIAAVLERRGLVAAALVPAVDARKRILRLTAPGRRTLEGAFPAWKEAQQRAERRPSPEAFGRRRPAAAVNGTLEERSSDAGHGARRRMSISAGRFD